jgi:hypothetical protein
MKVQIPLIPLFQRGTLAPLFVKRGWGRFKIDFSKTGKY